MSTVNGSPRHYPHSSSRPIGIRPELTYPRHPQSSTPPYTSADELRPHPSLTRPMMMPRPSYPSPYSGGQSGSIDTLGWIDPRQLAGTPQPVYSPPLFGTSAPEYSTGFPYYPYSDNSYVPQPLSYTPPISTPAIVDADTDAEVDTLLPSSKAVSRDTPKPTKPPPRPPNAWIIYRSDMLRAIARGDPMPKLDAAMAESGISSGESPVDEGMADSSDKDAESGGEVKKVRKKVKKPKKGSKEPTAGMLSLGKGKTGRGIPQADVSKLISLMWAREEPEVKKKYEAQSAERKKEHQEQFPDYKFQPLKRADKLRLREEREREKAEAKVQKQAEKHAEKQAGQPGARRKGRSRIPAPSPYASAMSRTKSASTPEVKDEPEFSMFPFPIPHDALPALHNGPRRSLDRLAQPKSHHFDPSIPPPPQPMYPTWSELPDLGSAYAVPYIFEPIPIPGEEFNMDLLQPLGEDADADALAALWCSVEEDDGDPGNTWDMTSSEAMQAWSELGSFPQYPASLELSSSIAEQIAQDWTASFPPDFASNMQPMYDPSLNLIQVPYYAYPGTPASGPEYDASALSHDTHGSSGPFLSVTQPLSPVEPWSSQGNPDAMPFRQVSTGFNRLASSSSHHSERYRASPDHNIPRHISSSAFPTSSFPGEAGGWADRSVSFSAFAAEVAGDVDHLLWDENGNKDASRRAEESRDAPQAGGTPTHLDDSFSLPTPPETAAITKGPPRNVRRPRTVGAAFGESN